MSEHIRPKVRVKSTAGVPNPNEYILALKGEFAEVAFDEVRTPELRGLWRSEVFEKNEDWPLDIEIGTGNGFHFAYQAEKNPERGLVGFELKYKPLIQSIRRSIRMGCENTRVCRYDAHLICDVFAENEVNDVVIHFPDPYLKKKFRKRRLITENFLVGLHRLQRPGSNIFFKTDSEDYFDWAMESFENSQYEITGQTRDLHNSEFAQGNFITAFERIFMNQGLPIYFAKMFKEV